MRLAESRRRDALRRSPAGNGVDVPRSRELSAPVAGLSTQAQRCDCCYAWRAWKRTLVSPVRGATGRWGSPHPVGGRAGVLPLAYEATRW